MALPTDPTAQTLCTEALYMAGLAADDINSTVLSRAYTGLQRIFNEIITKAAAMGVHRMETLQDISYSIGTVGESRFNIFPSNFHSLESVVLYWGTHTDTATAGGNNTVTLAADEDVTEENVDYIYMLTGTSANQFKEVYDYDTSTKIATTISNWDTNPVAGDTYRTLDEQYLLRPSEHDLPYRVTDITRSRPCEYSVYNNELYFDRKFDYAYIVQLRYYVNINMVNLTEGSTTLITKIYRNWQSVLEKCLTARWLKQLGDQSWVAEKREADDMVLSLIHKENIPQEESNGVEPAYI